MERGSPPGLMPCSRPPARSQSSEMRPTGASALAEPALGEVQRRRCCGTCALGIYAGSGFALIDPHGDIATEIADSVPPELTGKAVYFDPADLSHPIGFNPVERVPIDQRPLRAAHIIATFEHRWRDSWGPRMSYILQNAVRLLLDAPGVTLLGLPRLLTDEKYRATLLKSCADPVIRRYWEV